MFDYVNRLRRRVFLVAIGAVLALILSATNLWLLGRMLTVQERTLDLLGAQQERTKEMLDIDRQQNEAIRALAGIERH